MAPSSFFLNVNTIKLEVNEVKRKFLYLITLEMHSGKLFKNILFTEAKESLAKF